eukprot:266840_1
MGSLFTKNETMTQFDHLKPDNKESESSDALTIEQRELKEELLLLIATNFESTLKQNSNNNITPSNGHFPSKITENIFIGDHRAASNINIYDTNSIGITHVVNCAGHEFCFKYPSNVNVLKVKASDEVKYRIIDKHINDIISFVDIALQNNNNKILFHCLAGVNRSVTLCIAYMMHKYKDTKNIRDIMDLVSKQRAIGILSNVGFTKQLVQYNTKLLQN